MINRHSTKIVDALLMFASALGILAIAWAENSSPAAHSSSPDFRLIGPDNRTYTRASFPSDAVLVIYFGFTTCWRACPTALNAIAQAVDDLGEAGERVQPIFISLDPQREDPETVDLYLKGVGDEASRFSQGVLRPGIGYTVGRGWTVWGGYAYVRTDPPYSTSTTTEQRIWEQASWSGAIRTTALSSRTRMEQRFVSTGSDTGWRLREFVKVTRPLSARGIWSAVVSDEYFLNLN